MTMDDYLQYYSICNLLKIGTSLVNRILLFTVLLMIDFSDFVISQPDYNTLYVQKKSGKHILKQYVNSILFRAGIREMEARISKK